MCVCILDHGFIRLLEESRPTPAPVKEGESISLRVELDSYPRPKTLSWVYKGKVLRNTTEHVITIQRETYRYYIYTHIHCTFIFVGIRIHPTTLPQKPNMNSKSKPNPSS